MKEITEEKVKTRLGEILEENKKIKKEKDKRYFEEQKDIEEKTKENEKMRKKLKDEDEKIQLNFSDKVESNIADNRKVVGFIKRYILIGMVTGVPGIAITYLWDKWQENKMVKDLYEKNIRSITNPNNRELAKEYETLRKKFYKGQVKVIKIDKDNHEVKLKGVKFDILDEKGNILETITTNEKGEAYTSRYAIRDCSKLTIREKETLKGYFADEETKTIELKEKEITSIQFENEKIKGYIEITKISKDDNKLTNVSKGTPLENTVFEIYTENNELVDTITTDKEGNAKSKLLEYGIYYVKEKDTGSDYYLLNTEKYSVEIKENMKTIPVTIENTSVEIGLDIDKTGIVQAQPNDEIKYSFNALKNTSNVALDNFTWTDNLPYEYVRITKLFTGTYNEALDYTVKYKTNKSEDYIEYGKYNTQKNNYIDFTKVELLDDEYITDYKVEFGTVMPGFEAVEKPFIFAKVLPTVKADDRWVNYTALTGNYKEHKLEDKAEWPTISYAKKLEIKKLPRTGF